MGRLIDSGVIVDSGVVGDGVIRDARDERTHEEEVATLDGQIPVALLPVRIETRFFDQGTTLRIRIFPDDIHVHTHEPELTSSEESAAHGYWQARFADPDSAGPAWADLAARLGPHRAGWVVAVTTPANLDEAGAAPPRFPAVPRRDAPWTRPPQVAALPTRWVAIGLRGDQEVFRVWGAPVPKSLAFGPAPDPDDDDTETVIRPDPEQDELPIDDGMRWLVDFGEAERVGMALTVTDGHLTDGSSLAGGLTRLVVLGVDITRPAGDSAALLEDLLAAHRHTEGLSLVAPGAPTNNTGAGRTAAADRGTALAALDPTTTPPPLTATSDAGKLVRALGLSPDGPLSGVPGAGIDDGDAALHMHTALWQATWGYFLGHMLDGLVPAQQVAELRDHFRRHVRGGGPLGTLRVGDQPYGVLPVVAPGHWRPAADEVSGAALLRLIEDGRGLWAQASDRSPRLGRTGDAGRDLLEVLQHTPDMSTVRYRNVFGPLYTANTSGLGWSTQLQGLTGRWLFSMFGGGEVAPRINLSTLSPHTLHLTVPLVQGGDRDPASPPDPDYIAATAERLSRSGGFAEVVADQPVSLLHALVLHSAKLEMGKASIGWINDTLMSSPGRPALRYSGPELELLDLDEGISTQTPLRVAQAPFTRLSGDLPIAEHIAGFTDARAVPALHSVSELRDSLRHLAALPVTTLERLLKETLDVSSHRLDAWLTSLATRRLTTLRAARPDGIHLGGFGWVEDLRPGDVPDSLGYVHTPSLGHAAAAAILRNGHLTHASGEERPFAVDVSSPRVRDALALLDGVRQGQPIGALLGYRFERALRERDPRLARYILPLRRLAPLASDQNDVTVAVEAIAARDVVDGVALLDRWRKDGRAVLAGADIAAEHVTAVAAELNRLADRLDASADLLVAESVFQAVGGNLERAGAAAAALDRQRIPPEPEVVRTPRHGHDHVHRVGVLLGDTAAGPQWPEDIRSAAEPRLTAWLGVVLGNPDRFRFSADVLDDTGDVLGTVEARLPDLGLSPLSVLAASGSGGTDRPTELEERIALHLTGLVDDDSAAELRLRSDRRSSWPAAALSLRDLLALADSARALVGSARPLDATLLSLPEDTTPPGIDLAELRDRADAVVEAAEEALEDLDATIASPVIGAGRVRQVLLAASAAGMRDAVPAGDTEALREQAGHVARDLTTALGAARGALAGVSGDSSTDAAVAGITAAVRAILGADFPLLPRFSLPDPAGAGASLADRAALLGGDDLAAAQWLQRRSLVRSGAARLHELLTYAELTGAGTGPGDLEVLQLPHRPGDRWFAADLPPDGTLPAGRLSLAVHGTGSLDVSRPLAGLVVDDWMETIPAAVETTGLAFHYDAPASRAPQAVLLAVPPDPEATKWSLEALRDTVVEALELARLRAVDPQQIWLAGRVLPALYVAHNIAGATAAVDFTALQTRLGAVATGEVG